jgi:predicted dehydrogenase
MTEIRVAVLGASGWMGKVHTMAFQTFPHFFGAAHGTVRVTTLVEANATADLSFRAPGAKILTNWQDAVNDPDIDLIDICLPDHLHYPVAKAALLAGKHVYCEKPLADTAAEAKELADLARAKGVITRVGHAFPRNPVHDVARQIITSGQIGEITMFKGCQHVDVFADPAAPFMWRADGKLAPTGIIGDTGSHVFSFMEFLIGPVSSLIADNMIFTTQRPNGAGMAQVTNPDATHVMCRFANGARGIVDFSRVATGRKFRQTYEVYGTKGSLTYDYDQVNRLHVYSTADTPQGYRAIDVGPDHPSYAAFLPLPNFALGYNEMKIIEAYEVIRSITTHQPAWPTFDTGHHICQMVDACMESAAKQVWVDIPLQ